MIIQDKEKSIKTAHEISQKVIDLIKEESMKFGNHTDPAEPIYLNVHIMGMVLCKTLMLIYNYGNKVYGIENITIDNVKKWIDEITNENLELNKNIIKD